MRCTDNLCKMLFLSNPLLLSLVIYLFSVLEDDNRGNMIVRIVINNKGGTMFQLLTGR